MNYSKIQEETDAEIIQKVSEEIGDPSKWDEAYKTLREVYSRIPTNYQNCYEENGKLNIHFWDQEEFVNYCKAMKPNKDVFWLGNAYPRCCYLLSVILIERGLFNDAIDSLNMGLKLEPDNPYLLNELAFLYSLLAEHKKERGYFIKAIEKYKVALNSRNYNTNAQKARSLRGIGYAYIELDDFAEARKSYIASLDFEESENARNELSIIDNHQKKPNGYIYSSGSNFNKTTALNSYKFFSDTLKKLPQNLQDSLPNNFVYIWHKASALLTVGPSNYRGSDYFHYPLKEWDEKQIMAGVSQIAHFLKGFHPNHYITLNNLEGAKELLLTFHFKMVNIDKNSDQYTLIKKIMFKHIMDHNEIELYFEFNNSESAKRKRWKLW